jgi:hypothetical protein
VGSKLGNLGAVSCIPFVLCHLVPSRRASRPRFFSDLAHLAVFALSIDRFSFLGGIICACCGVVPSPLCSDLTRASHRGICLKGIRLRRSLPLPKTDTRKKTQMGKKWVANLVIPTKATQLATATAREDGKPYGSALPSETQHCEHGWEHGLLPVTCTLTFFHLCTPYAFCYSSTRGCCSSRLHTCR